MVLPHIREHGSTVKVLPYMARRAPMPGISMPLSSF